jgi:hypothetical protein
MNYFKRLGQALLGKPITAQCVEVTQNTPTPGTYRLIVGGMEYYDKEILSVDITPTKVYVRYEIFPDSVFTHVEFLNLYRKVSL